MGRAACAAAILALALPASAAAAPVAGERATVEMTFTTTEPGTSSGFTYSASFRDPTNPAADPPALRRLVIGGPEGARIDTTAALVCDVDDATLREQGESACPAGSRIGGGSAVVKPMLAPAIPYRTTLFNATGQQVELLSGDPPAPPAVVRGFIRGSVVDSPIPTCLNGGYAPADCPDDQVALVSNTLSAPPISTQGMGSERRSYLTTPPTCPSSGFWSTPITFYFGDGVTETLVTEQPCKAVARPSLPRLQAEVHPPKPGTAAQARKLPVDVRVRGGGAVLGVMAELRRVRGGGRVAPAVLGRTDGPERVRGKRTIRLVLRPPGLRPGRYVVTVEGRDARPATDRFRVK